MNDLVVAHDHKPGVAEICRVHETRLAIEHEYACRAAADETRVFGVAQALIGLDEYVDGRALVDLLARGPRARARVDEVLLDDALALLHETRAELGRVYAHLAPTAYAIGDTDHVGVLVRCHEPSIKPNYQCILLCVMCMYV